MSNNTSKKLEWEKEFEEKFPNLYDMCSVDFYEYQTQLSKNYCNDKVKDFIRQLLLSQKTEITDKLLKAFGLTIKDLPAFPPRETDLLDLILAIGKEKVRQSQKNEILKRLPKEKEPSFNTMPSSRLDEPDVAKNSGFNQALAEIIEIVKSI